MSGHQPNSARVRAACTQQRDLGPHPRFVGARTDACVAGRTEAAATRTYLRRVRETDPKRRRNDSLSWFVPYGTNHVRSVRSFRTDGTNHQPRKIDRETNAGSRRLGEKERPGPGTDDD